MIWQENRDNEKQSIDLDHAYKVTKISQIDKSSILEISELIGIDWYRLQSILQIGHLAIFCHFILLHFPNSNLLHVLVHIRHLIIHGSYDLLDNTIVYYILYHNFPQKRKLFHTDKFRKFCSILQLSKVSLWWTHRLDAFCYYMLYSDS